MLLIKVTDFKKHSIANNDISVYKLARDQSFQLDFFLELDGFSKLQLPIKLLCFVGDRRMDLFISNVSSLPKVIQMLFAINCFSKYRQLDKQTYDQFTLYSF